MSKLGLWWALFVQSRKIKELKIKRGGFMCHDNKYDTKSEEKMTSCFKIDMKNLKNFDPSTIKSIKLVF